jgi:hypothetical protein
VRVRLYTLVVALGASACQSFGVFSAPRTVKEGEVRLGAALTYHDFEVTGERQKTADVQVACQIGVAERGELDLLAYVGGGDVRFKHNFLGDGLWDLSLSGGGGLFTTTRSNETSLYAPVDLVGGFHLTDDISVFAGPKLYAAVAVQSPGVGAGFNETPLGLLGGGVAGIAMESRGFTFIPQITWMTPLVSGAQGQVVQVVVGVGTNVH